MKDVSAVILAAGKGSRMQSDLPKILHTINGKPIILYPLETLRSLKPAQIITVIKHKAELVLPHIENYATPAYQGDEYGTAKAVEAAIPELAARVQTVMVINGDDSMFYKQETFKNVVKKHNLEKNAITFITLLKDDPKGFGRVVYDEQGNFQKIVEEKDATEEEKVIQEVNDGVYLLNKQFLLENISKIIPSPATGEYYLTDLINMAMEQGKRVSTYLLTDSTQFFGISTQEDVQRANAQFDNVESI